MAEPTLADLGDAFEKAAAKTRRRAPTREPDPLSLVASEGGVPWSAFLPSNERALAAAGALQRGEDFDPRDAFLGAVGLVGSPGGVPLGALGSKVGKLPAEAVVALGAHPTTSPRTILNATKQGGYSVRVPTGERPTEGLMMGVYGNADPRNLVVADRPLTLKDIGTHAQKNAQALAKPERFFGTWRDPDTGTVYLDVSQRFPPTDIRQATKFGERTGQLAGYNVGAGESFPVGNWEQFIQSPEYHERMAQMAGRGREYLSQFPSKEWWDMHGSAFERVYGPQLMPQTAGLTASTAPNTAPRPNLQQMSEYMRRVIRGEPVVQPGFRTPEGTMTHTAGGQMPMELSRRANLEKAARGDIRALQMDKVREEALAMMGDPNAVVLDRHWARSAEAPERGIYTGAEEGKISSRPRASGPSDYQLLKTEVVKGAATAQRDPRDFSADAWTGIRDTIQKTNQLFGQKFKPGSITGESKSYADHFEDLIRDKAAHLRMTPQELEKRLRGGDADLLSLMLGAPTIGAAYRYWSAGQNAPASSADNRASSSAL